MRVYLTIMPNLHSGCLVEGTIRLRSTGGGLWQDDIILDLDVTPFIASSRSYSMGLNSVTNRA